MSEFLSMYVNKGVLLEFRRSGGNINHAKTLSECVIM